MSGPVSFARPFLSRAGQEDKEKGVRWGCGVGMGAVWGLGKYDLSCCVYSLPACFFYVVLLSEPRPFLDHPDPRRIPFLSSFFFH